MTADVRTANTFWIHAGQMSGDPDHRHQLELTDDLARFFDDDARASEVITIRLPEGTMHVRPLTYRGDDYGQWSGDIWRIGLPTARMGGPVYAGRVIRLDRVSVARRVVYDLTVADVDGPEAAEWEREAEERGVVDHTGGPAGRAYGYW